METWWKFENWFIFFWLIFLFLQTHTARVCPGGGQGGRGVRVWGREWRFRRRRGVCWCSRGAGGGKGCEKEKRGSDHFVFSIEGIGSCGVNFSTRMNQRLFRTQIFSQSFFQFFITDFLLTIWVNCHKCPFDKEKDEKKYLYTWRRFLGLLFYSD